jgi:hypothetical protein
MTFNRPWLLLAAVLVNPISPARADVITDWDERAVALIQPRMVPPVAYRGHGDRAYRDVRCGEFD